MKANNLVAELEREMHESQNQRDARIEALWRKLDPHKTGELDVKGLQGGLKRIDHREPRNPRTADLGTIAYCWVPSYEKCRRHVAEDHQRCGQRRRRQDSIRRCVFDSKKGLVNHGDADAV